MIRTATQLKAKVRNLSGGDSTKTQTLIRNFIMERFLERIALSQYRNNFILKGGMLVSAVVGLDTRATMDIDTTVKSLELSKENAVKIRDNRCRDSGWCSFYHYKGHRHHGGTRLSRHPVYVGNFSG